MAEYIALMTSAEEVAAELLNHLWYDPDWEYAARPGQASWHEFLQELEILAAKGYRTFRAYDQSENTSAAGHTVHDG